MHALCHGVAVAHMGLNVDVGREALKHRHGQRQSRNHTGLPRNENRVGMNRGRYGCNRCDVAAASEIFGKRACHRIVDGQRRQECIRVHQGGRIENVADTQDQAPVEVRLRGAVSATIAAMLRASSSVVTVRCRRAGSSAG